MSLDSPGEVIPFTRFLECRERLHRIAAAKVTVVMPASTELGIQPDVRQVRTFTMGSRHGASGIGPSTHDRRR